MVIEILRSKIHNAIVTQAELHYVGSITIDKNLMEVVKLQKGQKVLCVNNNSGARLETYVIVGERGSGIICLNGAAARHFAVGDEVIIMAFGQMEESNVSYFEPEVVFPFEGNKKWNTVEDIIKVSLLQGQKVEDISLQMGKTKEYVLKIKDTMR